MSPQRIAVNHRIHAKRRLLERFGMGVNRHEYASLVERARRTPPIKRQSLNRKVVPISLPNGAKALAIYDRARRTIVTFLLPGMAY